MIKRLFYVIDGASNKTHGTFCEHAGHAIASARQLNKWRGSYNLDRKFKVVQYEFESKKVIYKGD